MNTSYYSNELWKKTCQKNVENLVARKLNYIPLPRDKNVEISP